MGVALLLALLAASLSAVMMLAWAIARHPGKSGWTDAIWSFAVGGAGVAAALASIGDRPGARAWLVTVLITFWSLRLGIHIAIRASGGHDDPRYAQLRKEWGENFSGRLFAFLQIQALAGWILAIALLAAAHNPAPALAWSDYAAALVLAIAVIGEGIADAQLKAFRANPANARRVCDTGLWSWSRHPNYFFEWLGWCAYALIAIGPDGHFGWGWVALIGPAFMYWLLVHVSGIPPLEAHMLRSRGEPFRDLQSRVSAFWPLPPKRKPSA